MKLSNLPFKIESELVRAFYRLTGARPGSLPFVSGDGFRALADWRYEPPTDTFDPRVVTTGSLGYCDGWHLKEFLARFGNVLQQPFSLISHNADPNVTPEMLSTLPSQLTILYTTNCLVEDSRVVGLPIGLENARFHYNGVVSDFMKLRAKPLAKRPRILVAFTTGTNERVRRPALEALSKLKTVDQMERVNSRTYRKIALDYGFIASPPGNGEDCHRTWEALYLGSIPIVLNSVMTRRLSQLGLPLWLVDSYDELATYDESALKDRYAELAPGLDSPWLWMEAWTRLIQRGRR